MTQENSKQLLLKDLCVRLLYKPIVQIDGCGISKLWGIDHDDSAELRDRVIVWYRETYPSSKNSFPIIDCKPYIFPMSSMTETQKNEYQYITERWMYDSSYSISDSIDWLNKNHFDYRGLIEKSLALDATNLGIYE